MDLEQLKSAAADWRRFNEGRRDPFPATDLADKLDWAADKIESDAKVIAALGELIDSARDFARRYASDHPMWTDFDGNRQDPCGVHAWIDRANEQTAGKAK